jgi:YgiT-type zinc finger domain-containing protein
MPETRDDLEARLLEKARIAIREMLDQKGERRDLTMTEMENMVGDLEMGLRQSIMQELADDSQKADDNLCSECGGKLRNKGKRKRKIVTVRGEIEVERNYYICTACGAGYFPPRSSMEVK